MGTTIIPWHLFLEGLDKVPKGRPLDEWLQRWCFTEQGAVLVEGLQEVENLSQTAAERQIRAAFLIRNWMKNRPKTLH